MEMMNSIALNVIEKFAAHFGNTLNWIVRSPGRVNIIGEHLDYNDGFVLPAAIDKAIYVGVSKRTDGNIHLYAAGFDETFNVPLNAIQPTGAWSTYILGVVDQLIKRGHSVEGFNLVIDGDIPPGAGLSSSAAVECAVVFALNELFELGIDKMEMVKIAQKAEHEFSGVMCGIMDMFASMFGKEDQVIQLDCRSLAYEYKPLLLNGYKIILFDTKVKHSLASSAYNERRRQCEQGVAWIQKHHGEVSSLRDATMEMLDEYVAGKDSIVYNRCKYVVEEIQRLLGAGKDLENGDLRSLGKKMFDTHTGLSTLYEVSCKESDFLVDAVRNNPAVLGARQMGGGFGGCTINIVQENVVDELSATLFKKYKKEMGSELSAYVSKIENGTERIDIVGYKNVENRLRS